jgi:hypothetical protein
LLARFAVIERNNADFVRAAQKQADTTEDYHKLNNEQKNRIKQLEKQALEL